MTPEQRELVRKTINLATLPADVRAALDAERAAALARVGQVNAHAERIFQMRANRIGAERELGLLGDLEAPVRAKLNRMLRANR